ADVSNTLKSDVISYKGVTPDVQRVQALGKGATIDLELFDVLPYPASVKSVTRGANGAMSLRGDLPGFDKAQFAMSLVDDAFSMSVRIPEERLYVMVRSLGDGTHLMFRIDDSQTEPCGGTPARPPLLPPGEAPELHDHKATPATAGGATTGGCVQPNPTWDIAVVYTPASRSLAGGTSAIRSLLQLYIEEANLTYENSQIFARLRMVYCNEVNYSEGPDLDTCLNDVWGIPGVINIRNNYYADSVMLITKDVGGGCGLAWCCSGTASGVSEWNCWGRTFIHEHGHNLGCAHNPEDADCGGCYSYARGHRFFAQGDGYKTIMSYNNATGDFGDIWNFSNPNVNHLGVATGVSNARDNARAINNRRFIFNNFTQSHFEVWVDFHYGLLLPQNGTFVEPFRTLTQGNSYLIEGVNELEMPTMYIKEGTTAATFTFDKPMMVRTCGGTVTIGQ
ncbi:MAG: M12 family metallo-peptidase, partial [Phycisphaerae bacterium]